jgi:hypothetical protein
MMLTDGSTVDSEVLEAVRLIKQDNGGLRLDGNLLLDTPGLFRTSSMPGWSLSHGQLGLQDSGIFWLKETNGECTQTTARSHNHVTALQSPGPPAGQLLLVGLGKICCNQQRGRSVLFCLARFVAALPRQAEHAPQPCASLPSKPPVMHLGRNEWVVE